MGDKLAAAAKSEIMKGDKLGRQGGSGSGSQFPQSGTHPLRSKNPYSFAIWGKMQTSQSESGQLRTLIFMCGRQNSLFNLMPHRLRRHRFAQTGGVSATLCGMNGKQSKHRAWQGVAVQWSTVPPVHGRSAVVYAAKRGFAFQLKQRCL